MTEPLVHAVLPPPELVRFRELVGIADVPLDVDVSGWSKLALLTDDTVFLFPRRGRDDALLHGARVSAALASHDVEYVPSLRGHWPDDPLGVGPFIALERRSGTRWPELEDGATLSEIEAMLRSLGRATASWHRVAVQDIPTPLPQPDDVLDRNPWLLRLLDPDVSDQALDDAVRLLHPSTARRGFWQSAVTAVAALAPVLVHGDICENQLMVDEHLEVRTVLDWDTACVGHPLLDFDFGEWGFSIFTHEAEFGRLRRAWWEGYRSRRGLDLPSSDEVHLVFTLAESAALAEKRGAGPMSNWDERRWQLLTATLEELPDSADGPVVPASDQR